MREALRSLNTSLDWCTSWGVHGLGEITQRRINDLDFITKYGGQHNSYTDMEHTTFYLQVQKRNLRSALDRFAQFIRIQEAMEREREAIHWVQNGTIWGLENSADPWGICCRGTLSEEVHNGLSLSVVPVLFRDYSYISRHLFLCLCFKMCAPAGLSSVQ